jgi:hypothetical protein
VATTTPLNGPGAGEGGKGVKGDDRFGTKVVRYKAITVT